MRRPRPQTQPRSPRLSPRKGEEQSPSNDLGRYFGTGVSLGHRGSGLKRSRILQGRETNKPTIQKKTKTKTEFKGNQKQLQCGSLFSECIQSRQFWHKMLLGARTSLPSPPRHPPRTKRPGKCRETGRPDRPSTGRVGYEPSEAERRPPSWQREPGVN